MLKIKNLVKTLILIFLNVSLIFTLSRSVWAGGLDEDASCDPDNDQCMVGLYCDKDTSKCTPVLGRVSQPYGPEGYGPLGLGPFLNNVISAITVGSGILLFFYLVFGGFKYMTAGGDEKAVDAAKKIMTNAAIGLIIVVCAYFIVQIIGKVLGFADIFKLEFIGP